MTQPISSMTAFASYTATILDQAMATWEIRSVNHRYLDIQFRSLAPFQELEPLLRKQLKEKVKRGRLEIRLTYQPSSEEFSSFFLNEPLLKQLISYSHRISEIDANCKAPNTLQLLAWPDVLQKKQKNNSDREIIEALITSFYQTVTQLLDMRAQEGKAVKEVLLQRISHLKVQILQIRERMPELRKQLHQRLLERFNEAQLKADTQRIEQELLLILQKTDISEELDRLDIHLVECQNQLMQYTASGQRLDFLMQELNREANTLTSKVANAPISLLVIDMKVLIEEMREQIQNIE